MRIAALDYGTVTSRLLLADVTDGLIHIILKRTRITHLGEELSVTGRISDAAIDRVLFASQAFLQEIEAYGDKPVAFGAPVIRAVATSAMRDAANSAEVVAALAAIGIEVEVIAGLREAALCFAGTTSGFPVAEIGGQNLLVIDVGGGSTELTIGRIDQQKPVSGQSRQSAAGDQRQSAAGILLAQSFDIGARRVTDRFLRSDPPTAEELYSAREYIQSVFAKWFTEVARMGHEINRVFAVAGTPTSLIAIRDRLEVYDSDYVHGQAFTVEELDQVTEKLAAMPLDLRRQVVGLEPDRAPVVVGGMLVLSEVLKQCGFSQATVSETDILQGVILDTYQQLTAELAND